MDYSSLHAAYKETSLFGRYITLDHIAPLLQKHPHTIVGYSVSNQPIYAIQVGSGDTRILMWSQMHGNESTTTKAVFDLLAFLKADSALSQAFLNRFTFCILPMLNPDGAALYTRENAAAVDLNRDAQNRSQPESQVLRQVYDSFQPHYCYNLHDQRTIFGVADTGKPATVSFLAPSYNEERTINSVREKAMNVIVAMANTLQHYIPNQIGRFDDSFNLNCVGDTFQFLGTPTLLFEAGHYPNDYHREETRTCIFIALVSGLSYLHENDIVDNKSEDYLKIPQNKVVFYDFVYKNVKVNYDNSEIIINFAAQFKEVLSQGKVDFEARIAQVDCQEDYFGHTVIDAAGQMYRDEVGTMPICDQVATFYLGDTLEIKNGMLVE
jgi:serine/threonine protein kinase